MFNSVILISKLGESGEGGWRCDLHFLGGMYNLIGFKKISLDNTFPIHIFENLIN